MIETWNDWRRHEEEEERRRKEREREAANRAAQAKNVPASIKIAQRLGLTGISYRPGPDKTYRMASTPSNEFVQNPVIQRQQGRNTKTADKPLLARYMEASKRYGSEADFAKRVQAISTLWATYMRPFRAGETIFELADSEYSLEQLEEMAKAGHLAMFMPQRGDPRRQINLSKEEADELDLHDARRVFRPEGDIELATACGVVSADSLLSAFCEWAKKPAFGDEGLGTATKEIMLAPASTSILNPLAVLNINKETMKFPSAEEWKAYANPLDPVNRRAMILGLALTPFPSGGVLGGAIGGTAGTIAKYFANTVSTAKVLMGGMVGLSGILEQEIEGAAKKVQEKQEEGNVLLRAAELDFAERVADYEDAQLPGPRASKVRIQERAEAAGELDRGKLDEWAESTDPYVMYMDFIDGVLRSSDPSDVYAVQRAMQQDILDPVTGRVLSEGTMKDYEPTGRWDENWLRGAMQYASAIKRSQIQTQIWLIENKYASSNMELTGSFADPEWKAALELANNAWLTKETAYELYPEWIAKADMMNLPYDEGTTQQFLRTLDRNGLLGLFPSLALRIFEAAGGVYNGTIAAFELRQRSKRDPVFIEKEQALSEYVKDNYTEHQPLPFFPEDPMRLEFAAEDPMRLEFAVQDIRKKMVEARLAYRLGLENELDEETKRLYEDKELVALVEALSAEAARLIGGPEGYFGPDIISSISHLTGFKTDEYMQFRHDNPEVCEVLNIAIDIGASFGLLKIARLAKGGKVPRSVDVTTDSRGASRTATALEDIWAGRGGLAAEAFGTGSDASKLYVELNRLARGVTEATDSKYVKLVDDIWDSAKAGKTDEIIAALPRMDPVKAKQLAEYAVAQASKESALGGTTQAVYDLLRKQPKTKGVEPIPVVSVESKSAVTAAEAAISRVTGSPVSAFKGFEDELAVLADELAAIPGRGAKRDKAAKELIKRRLQDVLPDSTFEPRTTGLRPTITTKPAPTIIDEITKIAATGDDVALRNKLIEVRVGDPLSMASEMIGAVRKADDPAAAVRKMLGDIDAPQVPQGKTPITQKTSDKVIETVGWEVGSIPGKDAAALADEVWTAIKEILPKDIAAGKRKPTKRPGKEKLIAQSKEIAYFVEEGAAWNTTRMLKKLHIVPTPELYTELAKLRGSVSKQRAEVAEKLSNSQRMAMDVFGPIDKKVFFGEGMDMVNDAWRNHKSIFKDLEDPSIRMEGAMRRSLDRLIMRIDNDFMRQFLSATVQGIHPHIISGVDYRQQHFVETVRSYALVATRDVRKADFYARRAAYVQAKENPNLLKKLEAQLAKEANETYYMYGSFPVRGTLSDIRRQMQAGPAKPGEIPAYPTYFAPNPKTGEATGIFEWRGKTQQTTPGTSYMKTVLQMDTGIYYAPYKFPSKLKPEDATLFAKTMRATQFANRGVKNAARGLLATAHIVNSPLRQIAVGMGGLGLFQKHLLTDTPRTMLEETRSVRILKVRKEKEAFLQEAGAEARIESNLYRHMTEHTPMTYIHAEGPPAGWYIGETGRAVIPVDAKLKTINFSHGNTGEVANALRRIAQDDIYRMYANAGGGLGGRLAVEKWLKTTDEGLDFLRTGSHMRHVRAEKGITAKTTKQRKALERERAADMFLEEIIDQVYRQVDEMAPTLSARLQEAAKTGKADTRAMKQMIRQVRREMPNENIILSVGIQGPKGAMYPFQLGSRFGVAPDQANRRITFDTVWVRSYKYATKQGAKPAQAARLANEAAYLRTQQIHFDLSRGYQFEMKYRALAWFLTDQRLWSTWIARTGLQRPGIAGAVQIFSDWMERRNEELNLKESQRYNVSLAIGGGKVLTVDMRSMMWLTDWPQESTTGHLLTRGVSTALNWATGKEPFEPSPTPFGLPFSRLDEYIKLASMTVMNPKFIDASREDWDEAKVNDYLKSLTEEERKRVNSVARMQMQLALLKGESLTHGEALSRAVGSMWTREALRVVKSPTLMIVQPEQRELNRLQKEFEELEPGEPRWNFLRENPVLRYGWSMGDNYLDDFELSEQIIRFEQIEAAAEQEIKELYADGRLDNEELVAAVFRRRNKGIDELKENRLFKNWYEANDMDDYHELFGIMFNGVVEDWGEYFKQHRGYTQSDMDEKLIILKEDAAKKGAGQGMTKTDMDRTVWGRIMKRDYIREPYLRWLGYDPDTGLTWEEQSVARYLARGEDGEMRKQDYLNLLADLNLAELAGKGVRDGRGQKSDPFLATLTQEQKARLGINSGLETEGAWREWAIKQWSIKRYQRENGIWPTSKAGAARWDQFEEWTQELASNNRGFAIELNLSRMPLHERLEVLGVGEAGSEFSPAWNEFLSIVSDYHDALDNTPNPTLNKMGVGTRAQAAYEVTENYLLRVANLAKREEKWWDQFRQIYTLTKFGFYWRRKDGLDLFLWSGAPGPEGAFEAEDWWSMAQEEAEVWGEF